MSQLDLDCQHSKFWEHLGLFTEHLFNILRYEKVRGGPVHSLSSLAPGATIEVIQEFHDFDGEVWPVGYQFRGFERYNCVPYHGGFKFYFGNAALRLCDLVPSNLAVMSRSGQYFRHVRNPECHTEELIQEQYNQKWNFRLRFFNTGRDTFFYRQEVYKFNRTTHTLEWAPDLARPTSPTFNTLAAAEADAQQNVAWPENDRATAKSGSSWFERIRFLFRRKRP